MSKEYVMYVPPYEWEIIEPIKVISEYMKRKIRREEISDHHISRIFPVIEDFLQGRELKLKSTTLARIMDIFEKHYGFASSSEMERVNTAVAKLIDKLAELSSKDPVRVHKLLRNLRVLLIGLVRGRIMVSIEVSGKQL